MVLMRGVTSLGSDTAVAPVALAFLVQAGADAAVADAPRRWLDPPPAPAPAAAPAPAVTVAPPAPATPVPDTPAAGHPTLACNDGPALVALLAAFPQSRARPPFLYNGALDSGIWVLVDRPDETPEHFETIGRMIDAIGLDWERAALVSRLAWPQTGEPTAALLARFAPVLERLATLAPPRLVLALGQTAAEVAGDAARMVSSRGRWFDWRGARLLPSVHPRVFQGNRELRSQVFDHLKLFQTALA